MFGPDLGGSYPVSMDEEEGDSFGKRLLIAILPGAVTALIPVAFEAWKELRDDKRNSAVDEEEQEDAE